jgi:hypothetical protein
MGSKGLPPSLTRKLGFAVTARNIKVFFPEGGASGKVKNMPRPSFMHISTNACQQNPVHLVTRSLKTRRRYFFQHTTHYLSVCFELYRKYFSFYSTVFREFFLFKKSTRDSHIKGTVQRDGSGQN